MKTRKRRTKNEVLKNYTDWLNGIVAHVQRDGFITHHSLLNSMNGTGRHTRPIVCAKQLGYIYKVGVGEYKTNYKEFNIAHARNLRKRTIEHRNSLKVKNNKTEIIKRDYSEIKEIPFPKSEIIKPIIKSHKTTKRNSQVIKKQPFPIGNKQEKEFSLFWGLLKLKY